MALSAKWAGPVALAWLLPGGGHFLLKRPIRGALLMASIVIMFVLGLMMRGSFHEWLWDSNDPLASLIGSGGAISSMLTGLPYLLAIWMGYNQPDIAGHVHDYGTKFLIGAGLLNVLAMVDVYEIVAGKRD
jgi:hypothetical protein